MTKIAPHLHFLHNTPMPYASARNRAAIWPRLRLIAEVLYHQVERDRLFTQASALTYKTLFSLLPIFVLSLLILSTISASDSAFKQVLFDQLGINGMQVTDDAGKTVTLKHFVDNIIANAQNAVTSRATGAVAFVVLLYGAISLMVVIESTFNQIYGSVKARPWLRRIMLYWCVLTLGPIGVATSLTLGHQAFTALQASTAEVLPSSSTQPSSSAPSAADSAPRATAAASTQAGAAPPATDTATSAPAASAPHSSRRQKNSAGWALSLANIIFGFVVSWILILLMYRLIPDTRVRWRPAAIGSFLAALSWEIGKWGFGFYVATAAKNSAYGSLALLPLFMFWIYITWSVVLIGLEITYVQQYWPLLKRQYLFIRAARRGSAGSSLVGTGVGLSDLRWVLSLGILLYQRFKLGKPIHIDQAAEELMLPNDITAQLLISLERAGIVHPTATSSYTLARPPDTITAHDLLNAARAMCQAPPDLAKEAAHVPTYPKSKSMQRLEELESEWAKQNTLKDLAE